MTDGPASAKKPPTSRRTQARQFAMQAIYQHLLTGTSLNDLLVEFRSQSAFGRTDQDYFDALVRGILANRAALEKDFAEYLDRPVAQLDPVEHAVLLLAAFELTHCPELPYRVAINEAVELAKLYGAEESHKYINGVMDRLARRIRAVEIGAN
jgi:N utilization substance protein B